MSSNKTENTISYQLEIQAISPLYIGTQDLLERSPYTDYYVDGDKVCYIDEQKLMAAVQKKGLLDKYLNIVSEFDNNRAKESIGTFISKYLDGGDFSAYTHENHGLESDMRLPIAPTISSKGQAYVPGSSLKGALRTAILYHWLCKKGSRVLKKSFREIERLQATNSRKRQLRRNDYHARRDIQREENRILRNIFPEDALFGRITSSDARRIRVRDCTPVTQEQVGVYLAQRYRLIPQRNRYKSRNQSSIPQPRQAILPGTTFSGELNLLLPFANQDLRYLSDKKQFINDINYLAEDAIDNEIYQLGMAVHEGGQFKERAESLIRFYEADLKPLLQEPNTILLRLGGGKTIYDNSLLLALIYGDEKEREREYYFRILREALFGVREDHDLFPVTRTLGPGGEVFGWVKIKVVD